MTDLTDESPRCYLAVYADPNVPGHVTVESGRFGNPRMPANMRPGDMVLLYCTTTYSGYAKSVPGIGIVTEVDHTLHDFLYDYMPLAQPAPLEFVRFAMTDGDRERFANIRHDWLFQISSESFRAVMQGAQLAGKQWR
jgi:hypothetical protein